MKTTKTPGSAAPKSTAVRQLIASSIALGIVGIGAWSLLGQQAPYHPDTYDETVTRGGTELFGLQNED